MVPPGHATAPAHWHLTACASARMVGVWPVHLATHQRRTRGLKRPWGVTAARRGGVCTGAPVHSGPGPTVMSRRLQRLRWLPSRCLRRWLIGASTGRPAQAAKTTGPSVKFCRTRLESEAPASESLRRSGHGDEAPGSNAGTALRSIVGASVTHTAAQCSVCIPESRQRWYMLAPVRHHEERYAERRYRLRAEHALQ